MIVDTGTASAFDRNVLPYLKAKGCAMWTCVWFLTSTQTTQGVAACARR